MTEAGNPSASRGWEYDDNQPGNGNRTRATCGPGVPADTALYDVQDRLLSYAGNTFDWTAAGELLHRNRPGDVLTTTYDALGNLVQARLLPVFSGGPTGATPETTVTYRVDGQNRRVERRVTGPTGSRTQRWLYRDGLAVVAELDNTNALVNRYVYGTQDHVPDLLVRAEGTYRVITDHLGSIRALVDITTGAVAQRIDYDAWGNETANTGPTLQALGYAGGLTDPETKFIRFGARDYDPGVGRWTAKDPILFDGGGANLFEYVESSPHQYTDTNGLSRFREENVWDCMDRMAAMRYGGWLGVVDEFGGFGFAAFVGGKLKDLLISKGGEEAISILELWRMDQMAKTASTKGTWGARLAAGTRGAKVAAGLKAAQFGVGSFLKVWGGVGTPALVLSYALRLQFYQECRCSESTPGASKFRTTGPGGTK